MAFFMCDPTHEKKFRSPLDMILLAKKKKKSINLF